MLIAAALVGYHLLRRNSETTGATARRERRRFWSGIFVIWLAADWPVGALGAGYLVSVHTVQYLLFTLIAPPLLILGLPVDSVQRLIRSSRAYAVLRFLTRPLVGFVVFNSVLVLTHLPQVVDTLTASQVGSFAVAMAWIAAGLFLWWPAVGRVPELTRLSYPLRIGYLFVNTLVPILPAAFLTFADYPIYRLYELAPPIGDITARADQQVAGLTMKVAGDVIILFAMSVLFFRWSSSEGAEDVAGFRIPGEQSTGLPG